LCPSLFCPTFWHTKYIKYWQRYRSQKLFGRNVSDTATFSYETVLSNELTIGITYTKLDAQLIGDLEELAMKVGDILRKKAARISTIRMNETVGIAAQVMRASNVSALVVKDVVRTEGNTAVGMFTERDVVRAIAEHGAAGVNMKVSQLISVQQLVWCSSGDTLEDVRHLMNQHHIRHLPVIDNHSLCGVISIRDISAAFDEEAMATVFAASA
jgi:CBS domain-containing protein